MAISRVVIIEGCISCGLCAEICPEVFYMEDVAVVKTGVDFDKYESGIKSSAENCPVEVIKYQ